MYLSFAPGIAERTLSEMRRSHARTRSPPFLEMMPSACSQTVTGFPPILLHLHNFPLQCHL
jgi:hypothetical protein